MKAQRALARRAAGARAGGWVGARARPVCTHVSESDPAITQASLPQSPTLLPLHTHPRSRRAGTPRVLWRHCSKTMMSCCEAWTGWPSRWAGRRCTPPPHPPPPTQPIGWEQQQQQQTPCAPSAAALPTLGRPTPHPPTRTHLHPQRYTDPTSHAVGSLFSLRSTSVAPDKVGRGDGGAQGCQACVSGGVGGRRGRKMSLVAARSCPPADLAGEGRQAHAHLLPHLPARQHPAGPLAEPAGDSQGAA